jgi:elongation factor P
MISANQVRKGLVIKHRNDVFEIVDFQHVKPGKGSAFVKMRLKSLTTERTLEETVRPEDKLEDLYMTDIQMEYLYRQGDGYVFMDLSTYEQSELPKEQVAHVLPYLKENMEVTARESEGKLYGISLPNSVELKIVETAPNFKGDTSGGGKPATLETGAVVNVPFFIAPDEVIKVDTRTNEYLGRAKE